MPSRYLVLLLFVSLLFAACRQQDTPASIQVVAESTPDTVPGATTATTVGAAETVTPQPTSTATTIPTPTITPTPTRVPTGPLTVCLAQEPESLYLYGPASNTATLIREVVYDGPIDTNSYDVQPVILEELPTLDNGGATLETVFVREGDYAVDVDGNVVRLRPGVTVRPAGCYQDACAVTYERPEQPPATATPTAQPTATLAPDETPEPTATPVRPVPPPNAGLEMDRLRATFTLLPGLTWSDGEPLTADDSLFSYEVAQEAVLPPQLRTGKQGLVPSRSLDPLARTAVYSALDEQTVEWIGVPGYLDPNYRSNFFIPLPRHLLQDLSSYELLHADASARLPVGWGPYVLVEWTPGEQIVAERNPNYLRAGEELPYFDQVIFRFVPGDPERYLDDLGSGDCDLVAQQALHADYAAYQARADAGELLLHTVPGLIWEHLDFGINPVPAYSLRGDYFEDARVRQAAAYCLDREALASAVAPGTTIPDAYIPPQHPLYEKAGLATYTFNPEQGIALLREAGWQDINADGVVEAQGVPNVANGARLSVSLAVTPGRQAVAEQIASDLGRCGFQVTVEPVEPDLFFAVEDNGPIFGRRFDLAAFAWLSDAQPPCHLYLRREIPTLSTHWQGFNVSGFDNEAYDAACLQALASAPGMAPYEEGHLEALRIFNEELPAVPLYQHLRAALSGLDLVGLELNATAQSELWNVEMLRREE